MSEEGDYLEAMSQVLMAIKEDKKLHQDVLDFCKLPRHERMLRLNQLCALKQMDEQNPYHRVFRSLTDDQIAGFVVKFLNDE